MDSQSLLKFPTGFLWGAATAAHQIEGNNDNDWTEWEKTNAEKLSSNAENKYDNLNNWSDIKDQATNPNNYLSGVATDSYVNYQKDLDLIKQLGLNCYRLSIEWSRIEPEKGIFNQSALEYYRTLILELKDSNIEPFVTLWHFTLPKWIARIGGWQNKKTQEYFLEYVEKVIRFIPEVKFWITLNEPEVYVYQSYLIGEWPPEEKSLLSSYSVLNNLFTMHNKTYSLVKGINKDLNVGIVQSRVFLDPTNNQIFNRLVAGLISFLTNSYYLNRIVKQADFLGLNYYTSFPINLFNAKRIPYPKSDMGWEIYEEGIYKILMSLKRYNKPIYITENGIADAKDINREKFIINTLKSVHKAITKGVNVKGYIHWSLLDNFEWDKGFWPRFGLVEVNYETQKRKIKPSGLKYADIVRNNGLD